MGWLGRSATSGSPDRELGPPTLATGVDDAISEQLPMHAFHCCTCAFWVSFVD